MHVSFQIIFSSICPRVGLPNHMGVLYLVFFFYGTSILFSIMVVPIYVPSNSVGGSFFSSFSAACGVFDGYSDQCEALSQCILHSFKN